MGTLMLQGLPFNVGDSVEVIILERSLSVSAGAAALKGLGESPSPVTKAIDQPESNLYSLQGKVLFYEDLFELA
jgi:hypothetical protein